MGVFRAVLRPRLKVTIYQHAVVAQRLLSLPLPSLRQEIQREAEENPALELAEEWFEANGHEAPYPDSRTGRPRRTEAEQDDPVGQIPARISLQQHLWESFALEVSDSLLRRIAHFLVHSINDDGYLGCELAEVGPHLGARQEEVEQALRLVQALEPAGIGARDLRECLLIQIGRVEGDEVRPLAEAILRDYWPEFARQRLDLTARRMKIPLRQVRAAAGFIRARLSPYPGRGFHLPWQLPSAAPQPPPDVTVRQNGGLEVEIADGVGFPLRVSPAYLDVYQRTRTDGVGYTEAERRHVVGHVRRARLFLKALEQRRRTLQRIVSLVVSIEERFFREGPAGLLPISRKALARQLGVSLSTVSRALAKKHLLTPAGEVVSFDIFFDGSLRGKEAIHRLVEQEDRLRPLSDGEIARLLARQGMPLPRRTVAKYRQELRILPRSKRRPRD